MARVLSDPARIVLSIKRNRVYEWARRVRKSIMKLNFICIFVWILAIVVTLPVTSRIKIAEDGTNMCGTYWGNWFTNTSCKYQIDPSELENFTMTQARVNTKIIL